MLVHGGGSRMSSRSRQKPWHTPEFSNLLVNIVLLLHVDIDYVLETKLWNIYRKKTRPTWILLIQSWTWCLFCIQKYLGDQHFCQEILFSICLMYMKWHIKYVLSARSAGSYFHKFCSESKNFSYYLKVSSLILFLLKLEWDPSW